MRKEPVLPLLLLRPTATWAFYQPGRLALYALLQQAKLTACPTILARQQRRKFLRHSPKDRLVSMRV